MQNLIAIMYRQDSITTIQNTVKIMELDMNYINNFKEGLTRSQILVYVRAKI